MVMKNDIRNQRSYLLRLWVEVLQGKQVWRFSLEDTYTGERRGFTRLDELLLYIQTQLQDIQNGQ